MPTNIAVADEIVLDNGDHLTGVVTTVLDGILTLKTDYSEPIKIKAANICRIKSDKPVEVHLTNGEVLRGSLSSIADKQVEVHDSPQRKKSIVDWDAISAVNPLPPKPIRWKGSLMIAGSLQSGNTDKSSGSVEAQAVRKTSKNSISVRAMYKTTARIIMSAIRRMYTAPLNIIILLPPKYTHILLWKLSKIFSKT